MRVCYLFCGIDRIDLSFGNAEHEAVLAKVDDKFACVEAPKAIR